MKKHMYMLAGAVVVIAFGLCFTSQGSAADPSEDCAVCHEDLAADFARTVHGISARGGPSCITCHDGGENHMDEGGDPALVTKPKGRDGDTLCLSCHRDTATMFSSRSVHAGAKVNCTTCHDVHTKTASQPGMLRTAANDLCSKCHPSETGSFRKSFGHNLDRGGLQCVSCHNPHGGDGEYSLKVDRSGDLVCVTCHAEKRGPFVFPHVTDVAGTCMSCHEPHGSSNPMALTRSRVGQLCLECHSATGSITLGSQPPSFHDLRVPRYQNCTTCHVTVHGSNTSPLLLK